jgi:hypothetical protein
MGRNTESRFAGNADAFYERVANTGNCRLASQSLGRTVGWGAALMAKARERLNPDEDLGWKRENSAHCREWDAKQGKSNGVR